MSDMLQPKGGQCVIADPKSA